MGPIDRENSKAGHFCSRFRATFSLRGLFSAKVARTDVSIR